MSGGCAEKADWGQTLPRKFLKEKTSLQLAFQSTGSPVLSDPMSPTPGTSTRPGPHPHWLPHVPNHIRSTASGPRGGSSSGPAAWFQAETQKGPRVRTLRSAARPASCPGAGFARKGCRALRVSGRPGSSTAQAFHGRAAKEAQTRLLFSLRLRTPPRDVRCQAPRRCPAGSQSIIPVNVPINEASPGLPGPRAAPGPVPRLLPQHRKHWVITPQFMTSQRSIKARSAALQNGAPCGRRGTAVGPGPAFAGHARRTSSPRVAGPGLAAPSA